MNVYSTIRSTRWFLAGYPADGCHRLLDTSQRWSRDQMEDYRDKKLRDLIAHCYENVPYYRSVMEQRKLRPEEITSAADLGKLPILTKSIVRDQVKLLMAKNLSGMTVRWFKTGGTTGEPMRICKNKECSAWSNMCYERGLGWGGRTADEPMVRLFG